MQPWVSTDKSGLSSVGAALLVPANVIPQPKLTYGSAAPLGLNKCISMINPGLAPWAMKECRPCRALCGRTLSSICLKSSDLLGDIVVCVCCRICCLVSLLAFVIGIYYSVSLFVFVIGIYYSVSLFVFAVGFIGRCWRECRRHDTFSKPRVARVPKARTEPWVSTDKSGLSSVGAALLA